MQVKKESNIQGAWLDKKTVKEGDKIEIASEAQETESQFGVQLVAKVKVGGNEVKTNINKPSKNALIEAFGTETKDWVGKTVTAHLETGLTAGKRTVAIYMIPEGFEFTEDEGGYMTIINTSQEESDNSAVIEADDIPF